MSELRVGKVSNVDLGTGMVEVTYQDRESVTELLPFINNGGEYNVPNIGSSVLVAYLSTGDGVVIGQYWNNTNVPPEHGNLYRKELSKTKDEAYIKYDESNQTLTIKAPKIKFEQEN